MKVKSTIFDLQISGALGNVVGGRARGGIDWLRSRVTPSNPQSSFQSTVRNAMAALAGHWKESLDQDQRDAWDAYADAVPKAGLVLTGQNRYIGSNVLRAQVNAEQPGDALDSARIDDGPTVLSQATLSPVAIAISAATGIAAVTFTPGEGWDLNDADGCIIIEASPSVSPSRKFNNAGYRFAGAIVSDDPGPTSSPANITLPFAYTEDDRCFLHVRSLQTDGRYSPVQSLEVIVGA